jgi:hypothetical protein
MPTLLFGRSVDSAYAGAALHPSCIPATSAASSPAARIELTDGQLRRYNLSASYGIVSTTLLADSGWTLATLTGAANEWALGTTADGELVSYDLNPIRRYSLRPSTWTFRNLVSPGGGVYYAQKSDGSFYHFVDANPLNGSGNDIGPGKQIDAGGWTQRLLTAQPRTCT